MSNQGLHENDGPVFLAVSLGVPFVAVSFGVSLWFYTGRVGLHRGYGSTLGVWVYRLWFYTLCVGLHNAYSLESARRPTNRRKPSKTEQDRKTQQT